MTLQANMRRLVVMLAVFGGLAAGPVWSQQGDPRSGRWEGYVGASILMSDTVDFDGGSSLETDDDLGFGFGFAYNVNPYLQFGGEVNWNLVSYDGRLASADDPASDPRRVSGEFDVGSLAGQVTLHMLPGPITPYVSGLLGWTWVDTDIATGPPQTGCWWDPWYGYRCGYYYDTKTEEFFSYGLGVGLRWDFGNTRSYEWFGRIGYTRRWGDLDNGIGSTTFDSLRVDVGTRF